jgi:hypothetical protein
VGSETERRKMKRVRVRGLLREGTDTWDRARYRGTERDILGGERLDVPRLTVMLDFHLWDTSRRGTVTNERAVVVRTHWRK